MSERIEVRPDWPAFAGHFAGRPILPGIAHLALVRDALRRSGDPAAEIVAVSQVRFRQVIGPGDVLELVVDRRDRGEVFFELFREGRVASRGAVALGAVSPVPPESGIGGRGSEVGGRGVFPAAVALVPHRGPALLLDRVVGSTADELQALVSIPPDSPFVDAELAAPFVAIEAAAQAAAAHEALRQREVGTLGAPRIGFLVGARDVELGAALPVAVAIEVAIHVDGVAPPLSSYRFAASVGGAPVASGTVSTYLG